MHKPERNIRDLFLHKQMSNDLPAQSYFFQQPYQNHRRYSQEMKGSTISKLPSFKEQKSGISRSNNGSIVIVDKAIRMPAFSDWQKLGEQLPKRVYLNYKEQYQSPKVIEQNVENSRIHSPNNKLNLQKSFYIGLSKKQQTSSILNKSIEVQEDLKTQKLFKMFRYNYIFHYIIGWGGFGKVWKVESKKTRTLYAMKELSKAKVLAKKSVKSIMNERKFLIKLKHPFLVNMVSSFQDRDNLYLVMDYLSGGDLRYHIILNRTFKEEQIKFFVACIILGLEYMQNNNIIHRDIKPENLVLDSKGYLRITDLGIARILKPDNSNETSGTPGYMAPEVLCRQNHSFGVDHFAVGVIAFEMMVGRRPYVGRSRKEVRDEIIARQVQIPIDGHCYTSQMADFVNKLIQRKPQQRLGFHGIHELKNHQWFNQFQWDKLQNKVLNAPYFPRHDDYRQLRQEEESQKTLIQEQSRLLRYKETQNLFEGYTFNTEEQH